MDPQYWIEYTFLSRVREKLVKSYVRDGLEYRAPEGRYLKITQLETVWIDPRGKFTAWRCAAIIVLDRIMKVCLYLEKPLAEFCELLANFPT